ncbi:SAF domain-containing protein [Paenibacillus sp. MMO-58]|uniref:SAF domain-containing protein n=1 Tax=Paenibacillus sp. MMO-58 TaxID=3081290 RepID=UPI0030166A73
MRRFQLGKLNRILLYVVGMAACLILLYRFDTQWSKNIDTREVFVAARQIMPHETIAAKDLAVVRIKKDLIVAGAMQDGNEIVGKEALQLIEAGDQFTNNRIDKTALLGVPGAGIVELPDKWILSVPGSLRRLDKVTIFALKTDDSVTALDAGSLAGETANKILENIVVAYYKDSGSNEVKNGEESTNPNVRDDATVRGKKLELQLTDEQLKQLSALANKGNQFIIRYGS